MDSSAPINPSGLDRLLPLLAVLKTDLSQSLRHWAFIAWGVLGLAATLLALAALPSVPPAAPGTEGPATGMTVATGKSAAVHGPTAADFAARLLRLQVLTLSSFVIALGASAIAGEMDIAAEAILCRGISRWQYYGAKCVARLLAVAGLFGLLTLPAIAFAAYRLPNDLTWAGLGSALGQAWGVLAAVGTLAVAGSTWFRSPLIGTAVLWMGLYGLGLFLTILEIAELSPVVFVERLPAVLRGGEFLARGTGVNPASLEGSLEQLGQLAGLAGPPGQLLPALLMAAGVATLVSAVAFSRRDL